VYHTVQLPDGSWQVQRTHNDALPILNCMAGTYDSKGRADAALRNELRVSRNRVPNARFCLACGKAVPETSPDAYCDTHGKFDARWAYVLDGAAMRRLWAISCRFNDGREITPDEKRDKAQIMQAILGQAEVFDP
jgi:hypothetical protein